MRRPLFVLVAVVVSAGLAGCAHDQMCEPARQSMTDCLPGSCDSSPETCQSCCGAADGCNLFGGWGISDGCGLCDPSSDPCDPGCGRLCGLRDPQPSDPGPPVGAITYPYYTVRGPRDYLASDPRPIGP